LLAQLSHEINNPLNVVHNNIPPLRDYSAALCTAVRECRDLATDPAQRAQLAAIWERLDLDYIIDDSTQAFATMDAAIKRVAFIHRELKAFLRGEPPERELTDLGASLRATVTMVERNWPAIELRCELDPLPLVPVNSTRINQTITNLLTNAADAMHGRGRIEIRATVADSRVQIRVSDTGPGVPLELRSRIFEPFFTTKDIGQGLGLGLSICREIVVAHGGSLELDDGGGPGATFVIGLPLAA
jgi:signal transduction histidine kinase